MSPQPAQSEKRPLRAAPDQDSPAGVEAGAFKEALSPQQARIFALSSWMPTWEDKPYRWRF